MLELIPASKHATSDEYFGQYCIRFILGIGKVFFGPQWRRRKKKRCLWPLYAISPLSLSQTLRRDTYTNSRKLQTISMFHHTRALSNNSPCNLNVIYPPGMDSIPPLSVSPPSFRKLPIFQTIYFYTIRKRTWRIMVSLDRLIRLCILSARNKVNC